jgi:hypothetical protein
MASRSGSAAAHTGRAMGHRAANAQPVLHTPPAGGLPGMEASRCGSSPDMLGTDAISALV